MRKKTAVSIVHQRALNQVIIYASRAPAQTFLDPAIFIRSLRSALRMSQRQLARRSGLTQPHVALLEKGEDGVQLATLRRLFDAMFCDLLVLPRPRKRPGDAVAERRLENRRWHRIWND